MLTDDDNTKVVLFAFAAGDGLKEHIAPLPAIIQIVKGEAELTVGEEAVAGKPGAWIQMTAKTPHSIRAKTPLVILLTLLKWQTEKMFAIWEFTCKDVIHDYEQHTDNP